MTKSTLLAVATVLVGGLLLHAEPGPGEPGKSVTPSGLTIIVTQASEGGAQNGDRIWVHYTGTFPDGKEFDSSRGRGEPIEITLGAGQVIKGWDEGLIGIKLGEKRQLIIPPHLGYGDKERGPIPANSTLHFDVELVGIRRG
jgi:peptidylprolyl isomerase